MHNRKFRFIATVTVLLVVGFAATSLISYFVAHRSISQHISENTLPLTSDNIYSEIQRDLLSPIFISSLMARDTFLRDWVLAGEQEPNRIIRYLKEIQERYKAVTAFFVSDRSRNYYHPSGILKQVSPSDAGDRWYFRVAAMKDDYEINVDHDTADQGRLVIFINYRVHDYTGAYIGATGVGLEVRLVKQLIETYQSRYGRSVYFIDRNGVVTLHDRDEAVGRNFRELPGLAKLATAILTSPSGTHTFERNGKTVYLNSRLVPEFDWYLLVEQEEDPAEAELLGTLLANLGAAGGITALVLVLANLTVGRYQRQLEEMATTDKLTGLANRQAFELIADQMLRSARRRKVPISAVVMDIDHFKEINDGHGHMVGDAVIKMVASATAENIRESDSICRWGGEEFLILMSDCDAAAAAEAAETIRRAIATHVMNVDRKTITVTASFGVAQYQEGEPQGHFIRRADDALYAAKASGRNRVEMAA